MLCTNCGDLLDDGAEFCTKCGQRVTKEAVAEVKEEVTEVITQAQEEVAGNASVVQEGVAEATAWGQEKATEAASVAQEDVAEATAQVQEGAVPQAQPVAEGPAVSQPIYTSQEMNTWTQTSSMEVSSQKSQKKGPSKKVWILGAVAAVLIVLVAVVAINIQTLANSVRQITMSPQEYYAYIEKKQLQEMSAELARNYDRSMNAYDDATGQSMEYSMDVELGELVCEAISSSLGIEDVTSLSKIGLDFYFANKENVFSGGLVARLDETSLISLNALAQMEKGMIYLQLPELSKEYISADISEEMSELEDAFEEYGNMMEAYPEGAVLEDIINRYATIVIDSFEDVEKVKDVVAIGEYEEKCTALCATMTEAEMYTMLEAIMKEAKEDKELQDMLMGFVTYMDSTSEEEFRDSFIQAIDDYLENIDTYKAQADSNNYFSMSVMVNKMGEVIGRRFEVNDQEFLLSYMMPQEKDTFGYELKAGSAASLIVIEGEGTKTASDMTGEFMIRMDSVDIGQFDIATFVIESMDMKKWDEGFLDITCRIKPDAELYSELGVGAAGVFLAGYELIYAAHTGENLEEGALSLVNGSELIFKFSASARLGEYEGLAVPTDSILMETDEDLMEWIATMDFDKFMENISQSGLPEELVTMIQSLVDELKPLTEYYGL